MAPEALGRERGYNLPGRRKRRLQADGDHGIGRRRCVLGNPDCPGDCRAPARRGRQASEHHAIVITLAEVSAASPNAGGTARGRLQDEVIRIHLGRTFSMTPSVRPRSARRLRPARPGRRSRAAGPAICRTAARAWGWSDVSAATGGRGAAGRDHCDRARRRRAPRAGSAQPTSSASSIARTVDSHGASISVRPVARPRPGGRAGARG